MTPSQQVTAALRRLRWGGWTEPDGWEEAADMQLCVRRGYAEVNYTDRGREFRITGTGQVRFKQAAH